MTVTTEPGAPSGLLPQQIEEATARLERWGDLDLDRGMITVRKGKGAKPSWTLLPSSTRAALVAWRLEIVGAPPPFSPVDTAPVFPRQIGRGVKGVGGDYTPGGLGLLVQRILVRAGLWTRGLGVAHRFRRSFATQYLKSNPSDLVGLQRLMRHDLIATTQRYVWFEPEDLAPRMAAMQLWALLSEGDSAMDAPRVPGPPWRSATASGACGPGSG